MWGCLTNMSFTQSNVPRHWCMYCVILYVNKKQLQNKCNAALVHAWDEITKHFYFVFSSWLFTGRSESTKGPYVARGPCGPCGSALHSRFSGKWWALTKITKINWAIPLRVCTANHLFHYHPQFVCYHLPSWSMAFKFSRDCRFWNTFLINMNK